MSELLDVCVRSGWLAEKCECIGDNERAPFATSSGVGNENCGIGSCGVGVGESLVLAGVPVAVMKD